MTGRLIETEQDIAKGCKWLADNHPRFAYALECITQPPLRRRPDGFEALFSAIVSQQISVAAARGIWQRLEDASATSQQAVLGLEHEQLRGLGLSNQKATYAKALAQHGIDFAALRGQRAEVVVRELTAVKGIGNWTAEIYVMFSLGHADVFAPGDLALQEAARDLFGLPKRPVEKSLREMSVQWSPWRAVAARVLWSYYHVVKQREGIN